MDAFKSTNGVRLEMVEDNVLKEEAFDETFFIHLAQNGVRSIGFYTLSYLTELYIEASVVIDIEAALAFGFAEPNAGGDRCLTGVAVSVKSEIFTEVRRVAFMVYLSETVANTSHFLT